MSSVEEQIQAMIDRETDAWNRQDAESLVALFHPDMVWPWPPDENSHDPVTWIFPCGRYDRNRWKANWEELFRTHELVHNHRGTRRIAVSEERDGAFAVVDVDTLWRHRESGKHFHWYGRACKVYTKVGNDWLLISHTGLLRYPESGLPAGDRPAVRHSPTPAAGTVIDMKKGNFENG
jgi:ketosteroid isomerase-like protein